MAERIGNVHPGEVILEDYLKPLGMTRYALAKRIGITPSAVVDIVSGKRSITPDVALRLERFFGAEAQFWLNLQSAYDLEEQGTKLADKLDKINRCELVPA